LLVISLYAARREVAFVITSYAQNFEDVMLWRALGHMHNGFYIDIGAQDPMVDSVSLCFYEHGWRGVHVEPTPAYALALRNARPDETVLQVAIGDQADSIPFLEIAGGGLSTGDPDTVRRHETAGYPSRQIDVPCIRLSALLDSYRERDIHWMKIDVEGMELSVLRGWAPSPARPWVVVIESTLPLSQEPSHAAWEPIVLGMGYDFAYFDGLNRFYVSRQQRELLKFFSAPPNVFDAFALAGTAYHTFCTKLNGAVLKAQRECEQSVQDALAQSQRTGFVAQQLEQAKDEILQLLRHMRAKDDARSADLEAARADVGRLHAELGRQREDALARSAEREENFRLTIESVRHESSQKEQAAHSRVLAAHDAAMARVAEVARQHAATLESAKRTHVGHEQALARATSALEAQLRAEIKSAHAKTEASLTEALALRAELARVHGSITWQLIALLRGLVASLKAPFSDVPSSPADTILGTTTAPRPQLTSRGSVRVPTSIELNPLSARATRAMRAADDELTPNADMNSPRQNTEPVTHARELLSLHDEKFVRCAYLSVLQRPADPSGLSYYVGRLRQGTAKELVVTELARSPEGRSRVNDLPGLQELVRRTRPSRSIVSRLFRRLVWGSQQTLAAQLRQIDNALYRMSETVTTRFDRLEADAALIKQLVQRQPASATNNEIAGGMLDATSRRRSIISSPIVLMDKSPQGVISGLSKTLADSEEALLLSR
jgi:FkbM family methyltransferase